MELLTIKSDHKSMVPIKILIKTKWVHWTDTPHLPGRAGGGESIPSVHFLQSTHNFGRQVFKLLTNNPFCKIKIAVSNFFLFKTILWLPVQTSLVYTTEAN